MLHGRAVCGSPGNWFAVRFLVRCMRASARSREPSSRSGSCAMAISGVVINTRISVASWPSSGCCASRGSKLGKGCCLCDGKAFRLHSYGFMKSSNRYGPRRVRDEVSHGARSIVRRGRVFSRRSTLLRRLRRLCCQRKCHQLGHAAGQLPLRQPSEEILAFPSFQPERLGQR